MHSWRHFAKTYFKNDPRVKEEIHDAITGHGPAVAAMQTQAVEAGTVSNVTVTP
jgi:hypothetical protein